MTMALKQYVVKPCTGNRLEELLNDMWDDGYMPVEGGIQFQGVKEMENPLMPNQRTQMPLYTVIFQQRARFGDA